MNAPCAVTQDLNRHLAREELADQRAEAVDARCSELMAPGGSHSPMDADNLAEAITESAAPFWAKLRDALAGDAKPLPGDLIRAESENYWAKLALPRAEDEIDAERKDAADRAAESRAEDRRDHEREDREHWHEHD